MAFGKHTPELLVDGKEAHNWSSKCQGVICADVFHQVYDHEVSTVVVLDSPRLGTKYPAFWPPEMGLFLSSSEINAIFCVHLKLNFCFLLLFIGIIILDLILILEKPKKYGPVFSVEKVEGGKEGAANSGFSSYRFFLKYIVWTLISVEMNISLRLNWYVEQRVDGDAQASLVQEGGGPPQEDTVTLCRR